MKTLIVVSALAAAFSVSSTAAAQYPAKPVRVIVPFPAGGPADIVARVIAQPLSQTLGQPVLVENKSGADGAIAGEAVARSAPDGYTLFMGGTGAMATVPTFRRNPPMTQSPTSPRLRHLASTRFSCSCTRAFRRTRWRS